MPLKLTFDDPDFPKGHEFDVGGVLVKNGSAKSLSESEEQSLVARHGMSVKDYFKGSESIKVEGTTELSTKELQAATEGGEK